MNKKHILPIVAFALSVSMSGCVQVGDTVSTDDGYYAEQRMSEIEYDIFISKKTSTILDKLAAHAATAVNVANGEYDASAEVSNVAVTVSSIDEAYNNILKIGAAIDYEKARENLLLQIEAAKEHLLAYSEILSDPSKIDSETMNEYAELFKNDFTAIKSF